VAATVGSSTATSDQQRAPGMGGIIQSQLGEVGSYLSGCNIFIRVIAMTSCRILTDKAVFPTKTPSHKGQRSLELVEYPEQA
jgi:hypothetical protein